MVKMMAVIGTLVLLSGCGPVDLPAVASHGHALADSEPLERIAPQVYRRSEGTDGFSLFAHGKAGAEWVLSSGFGARLPQQRAAAERFLSVLAADSEATQRAVQGDKPEAARLVIPTINSSCIEGILAVEALGLWDNAPDFPLTGTATITVDGSPPVFNFGSGQTSTVVAKATAAPACGAAATASAQVVISGTGPRSNGVVDYVFAFTNRTGILCPGACKAKDNCNGDEQEAKWSICN